MSTVTAPPISHRSIWHDPLGHHVPKIYLFLLLAGVGCSAADAVLFAATLTRVATEVSWVGAYGIAIGMIGLASSLAYITGAFIKGRHYISAAFTGLAWLTLGGVVAGIRVFAYDAFDDATLALHGRLVAAMLVALYLAGGILLICDGYKLTNAARTAMRRVARVRDQAETRLADIEPLENRLTLEVVANATRARRVEEHYKSRRREHHQIASELKEHARHEAVRLIADEAQAGGAKAPHRPTPSDPGKGPSA